MVTMPIMLAVFALLHLKWRTSLMIFGVIGRHGGTGLGSPRPHIALDAEMPSQGLSALQDGTICPTSIGLRLEFWQKSLRFIAEAPVIGHGTGSHARAVRAGRDGRCGPRHGKVIGNPHNQTLDVAVQWGTIGVILLYAMWLVHLLLFRGEGLVAWIGLLVVVQNIFTSLFNSHIFDFHEGWMYVLGVGVAGGMTLAARQRNAGAATGRVVMTVRITSARR